MSDINVQMPDGSTIQFPAGTSPDVMSKVAKAHLAKKQVAPASTPAQTFDFTKNLIAPGAKLQPPSEPSPTLPSPVTDRKAIDKFRLDFFNTDNPDANVPKKTATALAKNPQDADALKRLAKMSPVAQTAIREHAGEIKAENDRTQAYIHSFDNGLTAEQFAQGLHGATSTGNPISQQAYAAQQTPGFQPTAIFKGPEGARQGKMTGHGKLDASLNVLSDFAGFAGTPEGLATSEALGIIAVMGKAGRAAAISAGTALGERDAYDRYKAGDKQGAVTSAVLGMIPVIGESMGAHADIVKTKKAAASIPAVTDIGDPGLTRGSSEKPTPVPIPEGTGRINIKKPFNVAPEVLDQISEHNAKVDKEKQNAGSNQGKPNPQDNGTQPTDAAGAERKETPVALGSHREDVLPGADKPDVPGAVSQPTARDLSFSITEPPKPAEPGQTKLANEHVESERKRFGLDSLPDAIPDSHKDAYERALATGEHDKALTTAQQVLDKSRVMTIEEAAGNSMKQHEVKNTVNSLAEKIRAGVEAGKDTTELQAQYDSARQDFKTLTDASKRSGTLQSQAFSFRQEVLDDYSHNNLMQRLEEARPEQPLTPEETEKAGALAAETKKAIDLHDETQTDERKSQLAAEEHVEKLQRQARRQVRTETKAKILKDREEIQKRFIDKTSKLSAGIDVSLVKEIGQLAASHVKEGVLTVEDLVDRVHDFVKDHIPDVTKREVRDAISGYGYDKPIAPTTVLGDLKEQARLMSKIEDVHDPLPPGTPRKVSDAVMKLREEYKQAKENMSPEDKALLATKRQIENIEKKIKAGDATGPKRLITVDNPEMMQARKDLKATRAKYNAMVKAAKPAVDPFKAYKASLDKKIAGLNDQISRGVKDPPKTRARRIYDAEVDAKRTEVERLKKLQDQMVAGRKTKTRLQKFARYHRAVILSRASTLGKLAGAAAERLVFTPAEELAGGALRALPGYGKIAAKAPNARGTFGSTGKMFSTAFSKAAILDARTKLRTGMNSLDALHGDSNAHLEKPDIANYPGRVHGAIKTPVQLAAYESSIVKQEAWAKRNGYDLTDPSIKGAIETRAYLESKRAILMQENTVTNLYKGVIRGLENNKVAPQAGRNVAAGLRTAMPIVSVPTNFAGEVGLHTPIIGLARPAYEIAVAHGIENLTPEQADVVVRALKKQSVGVALFAIGYYNSSRFGGYYQKGGNKTNDLDPGSVRVNLFGHEMEVPHTFLHSPQMEVMTMGAAFRQSLDHWRESKSSESRVGDAGFAVAKGFSESIPFVDLPTTITKAQESPKAGAVIAGQTVGGALLPGLLPDLAAGLDKDSRGRTKKRTPQGGIDALKMAAGLRKLVPEGRR